EQHDRGERPDLPVGQVDDPGGPVDEHEPGGEQAVAETRHEPEDEQVEAQREVRHQVAPAPRKTARTRSPSSTSCWIGPEKRTSPFSMNTARSAKAIATLRDCSTISIVRPSRRRSAIVPR